MTLSGVASGQQTYHDHGPLQPLTFKALTVDAVLCNDDRTEATILGEGSIDGAGSFEYRIRLADGGAPGTNDMYGIIIPLAAYDSGEQPLEGGNIQIR